MTLRFSIRLVFKKEKIFLLYCINIKYVLDKIVNFEKSSVCFSKSTPLSLISQMFYFLGDVSDKGTPKYLGLPMSIGRTKKQVFSFLKQKLLSKVSGWKEKFLNSTTREVLIMSVIMSLLVYVMSCKELRSIISHFLMEWRLFWKTRTSLVELKFHV
ncbi:hypothetical protein ACH5RR_029521 [Cinchona calisaya]|uniref:Uncharacterized protein n=1 Tax=Cinchona calisaya TaxID=153742 RepID=A0ABD2YVE5_9GENT